MPEVEVTVPGASVPQAFGRITEPDVPEPSYISTQSKAQLEEYSSRKVLKVMVIDCPADAVMTYSTSRLFS